MYQISDLCLSAAGVKLSTSSTRFGELGDAAQEGLTHPAAWRASQGHIHSHNRDISAIPGRDALKRAGLFVDWEILLSGEVKGD